MPRMKLILLYCYITLTLVQAQSGLVPTRMYSNRADLADEKDKFVLYWEPRDDSIVFEVHARTGGWVGLGVSREGGMDDTDIVLGWVKDDGSPVIQDRYSETNGVPSLDARQDLTLISGKKTGNYVILVFSRKLKACEDKDVSIENMNMKLAWAMGSDIPGDGGDPIKHRDDDRGTKTVLLLSPPETEVHRLPDGATSINIMANKVNLKTNQNRFLFVYKRIPQYNGKRHVVMWEPLIQPGNEDVAHHFVVFLCYNRTVAPDHYQRWQGESSQVSFTRSQYIATWSVGGGRVWLPNDVGISIGGPGNPLTYVGVETMYHNLAGETTRRDSSGIRLWVTDRLRQNEASTMFMGTGFSSTNFVLPPQSTNFILDGYCTSECLQQAIGDKDEIKIAMVMFHSHLVGSSYVVRHVRNGVELPPIANEKYHDPEFQEFRRLPEPVTVRKTDDIIVECGFDTSNRGSLVTGDDTFDNEMCIAIVVYYPDVPFRYCMSLPTDTQLLKFLNLAVSNRKVTTPGKYQNQSPIQVLSAQDWTNPTVRRSFQSNIRDGEMRLSCIKSGVDNSGYPANGKVRTVSLPTDLYHPPVSKDCPYVTPPPNTSGARPQYRAGVPGILITFMLCLRRYE